MLAFGSHIVHFEVGHSIVNFVVCILNSISEWLFTSYLHINVINSTVKKRFQYSAIREVFVQKLSPKLKHRRCDNGSIMRYTNSRIFI
jgi:hypothetical protein